MAADAEVIARIQKLLNVKGRDENEAAQFVAKARALMDEHQLSMEDLDTSSTSEVAVVETAGKVYGRKGKPEQWKTDLAKEVARDNDCQIVDGWKHVADAKGRMTYENTIGFIGFKQDVELAHYTYDYLSAELTRLSDEYVKGRWQMIWDYADQNYMTHQEAESDWVHVLGNKHPLASRKYWLEGAALGVRDSLRKDRAERRAASANLNALVVQKDSAVRDYIYRKRYGKSYDDMQAVWQAAEDARKAARAVWEAEHPKDVGTPRDPQYVAPYRPRASRATGAAWERQYNAEQRRAAQRDEHAYNSGLDTGRRVSVRPGVGGSRESSGRIDR